MIGKKWDELLENNVKNNKTVGNVSTLLLFLLLLFFVVVVVVVSYYHSYSNDT